MNILKEWKVKQIEWAGAGLRLSVRDSESGFD